jgi:hypothetical protein
MSNLMYLYSDRTVTLLHRINENLEMKYEHLRGLSGLQAKDLRKITNLNMRKTNTLSNILKNSQTPVKIEGRIKDQFKANDHIICDVDSLDMWVKFTLELDSTCKSLDSELELKIDKDMMGE